MRIIGGFYCGMVLVFVGKGDVGVYLCLIIDCVCESLFNVFGGGWYGDLIMDVIVLDLFVGIGVLGLEVLSWGVLSVIFVDNGCVV